MSKKPATLEEQYQKIADCIVSDQMPPNRIAEWFANSKFYAWFKKRYR